MVYRNEGSTFHRQDQSPLLLYHDTEQLSCPCDHTNASHDTVEMDSQSTSDAPTAAIIDTPEFQTMDSNGTMVLPSKPII